MSEPPRTPGFTITSHPLTDSEKAARFSPTVTVTINPLPLLWLDRIELIMEGAACIQHLADLCETMVRQINLEAEARGTGLTEDEFGALDRLHEYLGAIYARLVNPKEWH